MKDVSLLKERKKIEENGIHHLNQKSSNNNSNNYNSNNNNINNNNNPIRIVIKHAKYILYKCKSKNVKFTI